MTLERLNYFYEKYCSDYCSISGCYHESVIKQALAETSGLIEAYRFALFNPENNKKSILNKIEYLVSSEKYLNRELEAKRQGKRYWPSDKIAICL